MFKKNQKCVLKSIILNMENHNVSTSNILMEMLGDDMKIAVTLRTTTKDIGIKNKDSAPTSPCDNQTKWTALKMFELEKFFLIKTLILEIKDLNHEATNLTFVAMLMEQVEYLKEEKKVKNSIILSLTNQYNNIFDSTTTYNSNNSNDDNINSSSNNNNNDCSSIKRISNNKKIILLTQLIVLIIIMIIMFPIINVIHLNLLVLAILIQKKLAILLIIIMLL